MKSAGPPRTLLWGFDFAGSKLKQGYVCLYSPPTCNRETHARPRPRPRPRRFSPECVLARRNPVRYHPPPTPESNQACSLFHKTNSWFLPAGAGAHRSKQSASCPRLPFLLAWPLTSALWMCQAPSGTCSSWESHPLTSCFHCHPPNTQPRRTGVGAALLQLCPDGCPEWSFCLAPHPSLLHGLRPPPSTSPLW